MESIDGSHIWLPFVGRKCSRKLEKKKIEVFIPTREDLYYFEVKTIFLT